MAKKEGRSLTSNEIKKIFDLQKNKENYMKKL